MPEPNATRKRTRKRLYEAPDEVSPTAPIEVETEAQQEEEPTQQDAEIAFRKKVDNIINTYSYVAAGTGLIPIPVVDMAAISTIQLEMLRDLTETYGLSFSKQIGKTFIASLAGGYGATVIGTSILKPTLLKILPGVGFALGATSVAIMAGATSYAIGHAFAHHFEAGGTLVDFDPEKMRAIYQEKLKVGKERFARRKDTN